MGSLRGDGLKFGIVAARFNEIVTKPLLEGVLEGIERHGGQRADVDVRPIFLFSDKAARVHASLLQRRRPCTCMWQLQDASCHEGMHVQLPWQYWFTGLMLGQLAWSLQKAGDVRSRGLEVLATLLGQHTVAMLHIRRMHVSQRCIHCCCWRCSQVAWVPGSFELPLLAAAMARSGKYDAVITVGAVVRIASCPAAIPVHAFGHAALVCVCQGQQGVMGILHAQGPC